MPLQQPGFCHAKTDPLLLSQTVNWNWSLVAGRQFVPLQNAWTGKKPGGQEITACAATVGRAPGTRLATLPASHVVASPM
jgi:hypothetical protein